MHALIPTLFASIVLLTGCAPAPKEPLVLHIAVNDIYCTDTACYCVHDVAARGYFNSLETLKSDYDVEIEFTYFIEPYQLEEALLSGQYDGALTKPWFAMRLAQPASADFQRVADLVDPNGNRWLSGIVIVPVDSPIKSLDELSGKHLYLGEADSYEKHQAAKRLLVRHGIEPAKISTHASCGENIGVLLDEEADAALISDYALSADCAVDFANPEDFRILAHTEKIPLTSLLIDRNKVSPEETKRLQHALFSISGDHAHSELLSIGFVSPAGWNPPELEVHP